jgi:NAD(P)-dependent dehydrogenase (short-subunit alcohol dehydrogenase family)
MANFILITGASSGIGESTCASLVRHGYRVLAGVRNDQDAIRLVRSYGDNVYPLIMDVTDEVSMLSAYDKAEAVLKGHSLVTIINNAGISIHGAFLYIPLKEWKHLFEVNVFGVIRTIQLFFPLLRLKSKENTHPRRIINISSVSGVFASPFLAPYCSSKFALEALSDSLRRELYMDDIEVVVIQPGNINTPMWSKAKESLAWLGPEYEPIRKFKDTIIEENVKSSYPSSVVTEKIVHAVRNAKVRNRYLVRKDLFKFRLIQWMPASWVDSLIRRKLRKESGSGLQ